MFLTVFGLRSSIELTLSIAYPAWLRCTLHEFCHGCKVPTFVVLHTIESIYLELLVLVRKIYNNDDITFFSVY